VRVSANLVIGSDGSTTIAGHSAGLSSQIDRKRFHQLRENSQVILIGGNTARNEPYSKTPKQLIVVTKLPEIENLAPNTIFLNLDPVEALTKVKEDFSGQILIEGGPSFLKPLLSNQLIENFYVTVSKVSGGEGQIDLQELTQNYELVQSLDNDEDPAEKFLLFKPKK
jgi:riboflavin biosynthesis pyrimidine reductase